MPRMLSKDKAHFLYSFGAEGFSVIGSGFKSILGRGGEDSTPSSILWGSGLDLRRPSSVVDRVGSCLVIESVSYIENPVFLSPRASGFDGGGDSAGEFER